MDDLMATAAQIRAELEQNRGQWKRIAQESGVPYKTIKNFMQRPDSFPRVPTLHRLQAYFQTAGSAEARV